MPITLPQLKICKKFGCYHVATSFDGWCKVHAPRRPLKSYSSSPKVPVRSQDPIGVELEMFNPNTVYNLTNVARFVCSDGSLPAGGGEIKLCNDAKRIADIAADTTQRARLAGAEVNRKCGFHVHMSLRHGWNVMPYSERTQQVRRLYEWVIKYQNKFFDIMPPSRYTGNYSQALTDESHLHRHYSWITFGRRSPTLEIRIHGGTTNPWKVKGWLEFCIKLRSVLNHVLNGEYDHVPEFEDLSDLCPIGSLAQRYIQARERSRSLAEFGF